MHDDGQGAVSYVRLILLAFVASRQVKGANGAVSNDQ